MSEPGEKYDLAISLRFGETNAEMVALKAALVARGYNVFLCDETPGANLKRAIFTAFGQCDLAVIAGSLTYGQQTLVRCVCMLVLAAHWFACLFALQAPHNIT